MPNAQYQDSLGTTAARTVRLLEPSIADDDEHLQTVQADAYGLGLLEQLLHFMLLGVCILY
jgi:hypothetical protein